VPPAKKTTVKRTSAARPDGHQPFGPFARSIVEAIKNRGLDQKTVEDLDWRLDYLVTELGRYELLEIDVERVDDFRDGLAKRSQAIRMAEALGKPLMETVKQPAKSSYARALSAPSRTPLSTRSSRFSAGSCNAPSSGVSSRSTP
jgi:hypothetical protein